MILLGVKGRRSDGPYAAAREPLLRRPPRLIQGILADFLTVPSYTSEQMVLLLDESVPGPGKTFTVTRMIRELLKEEQESWLALSDVQRKTPRQMGVG